MKEITIEQLQDAYYEGFSDGFDHRNLSWKYPPENIAWYQSYARQMVGLPYENISIPKFGKESEWPEIERERFE